jgi:hypothetical protein
LKYIYNFITIIIIIEFEPNRILACSPPKFNVYYKNNAEFIFQKIILTYEELKYFLETYGFETNNLYELNKFGVSTNTIKENKEL